MLISLFFLFGLVAVFFAEFKLYAWGDWLHYFMLLNAGLIFYCLFILRPKLYIGILISLVIAFLILLLEFLIRCFIGLSLDGYLDALLVYPNPGNIRFLNQVHVQLFFLLISFYFLVQAPFRKWIIFFSSLGVFMLAVGGSRGAILALICSLLLAFCFYNQGLKSLGRVSVIVIALGLGVYFIYEHLYLSLVYTQNDRPLIRLGTSGRFDMWLDAFSVFKSNLFGVGPYHYGTTTTKYSFSHTHNSIVQFFLEWGVLSGALFCLFLLKLMHLTLSILRKSKDFIVLGLSLSISSALIYSLFGGLFVMPASQIVFVVLMGMFFAKTIHGAAISSDNGFNLKGQLLCNYFIMFTLLIMLCLFSIYSVVTYRAQNLIFDSTYNVLYKSTGPRMWVRGGVAVVNKR